MGRGLISDDIINQIRDRVDIADIVGHHVSLTRAGQNLKGLCPFHQEKSPSFTVSPSRQIFHCFGCGAGGNVFSFLTRITGVSFPEAVRDLGRKVGIEVQESAGFNPQAAQFGRIEQVNQAASSWFHKNLQAAQAGGPARNYLAERGIEPATITRFAIGVALGEWEGLIKALTHQGFTAGDLAAAGLTIAREQAGKGATGFYDRFRARVMFPIVDLRKRVVGFGGRTLGDGTPKYLNSPDTPLFKKGQTLFAFDQAREAIARTKTVIVVEGYFDAIALHQAGITHTVATLGTALTAEHIQALRRFATNVVLLFDPDAAGVRAALRGLDLFVNSGLGVKVVTLPDGDDPDTYVRKAGAEAFARLEAAAPSLLDYALEHSVKEAESGSLEGRIRSVDEILRILQKSEHPIEREERLRVVAERLGINQQRLIERYPALIAEQRKTAGSPAPSPKPVPVFKGVPEERDLAFLLLQGKLSPADIRRLNPELFSIPACQKLVECALAHLGADGRVEVRAFLDAAMEDPDCGSLATEFSLRDDHFDDLSEHIKGCLDQLDRKRSEAAMRELISRLKGAEREGRWEDVQAINLQVNELQMRKAGTPVAGTVSLVKE
ncbi:DNA primase [Nitrospira lenta]|uniref:DNA primase n=1 Tax=Nitrospira lenta TaxID=1436998 RepID=A0A330L3H6_9BACT|nr:DNA primase [Nitrospira lenta]SPP63422.1 DNA primase [Nitrospira lenta]